MLWLSFETQTLHSLTFVEEHWIILNIREAEKWASSVKNIMLNIVLRNMFEKLCKKLKSVAHSFSNLFLKAILSIIFFTPISPLGIFACLLLWAFLRVLLSVYAYKHILFALWKTWDLFLWGASEDISCKIVSGVRKSYCKEHGKS